jgi:uncharacterized protein (TIRG00374 family)
MKGSWGIKTWSQVFGWSIGAVSLYIFASYFFDWQTTIRLISDTQILFVCASIIFFFATLLVRAIKWTYVLRLKEHATWKNGYHTNMISNMSNFILPIRFGEIAKLYIINKVDDVSYTSSISATLIDRFSHLFIMAILLLFTPTAGFVFFQRSTGILLFIIPLAIFLVLLFIFGSRSLGILRASTQRVLSFLIRDRTKGDRSSASKVYLFCREILEKMNISTFTKVNLIIIVFFSLIVISLDGICFYFIIRAFSLPITWFQGVLAACLMNLMFILPTPPGQIGTAEMYPVLIFSGGLGFPSSVISSMAILWHLLTTTVLIVLGVYSTVTLGIDLFGVVLKVKERRVGLGQ